jgi:hypothetical protein
MASIERDTCGIFSLFEKLLREFGRYSEIAWLSAETFN